MISMSAPWRNIPLVAILLLHVTIGWGYVGTTSALLSPGRLFYTVVGHSYARSSTTGKLHMVSKKEKKRLQEAAKKREGILELERHKAQRELIQRIKDTKTSKNKGKNILRDVKKLVDKAKHDGLEEIGLEAHLMLLELSYRANRPSDMNDHLIACEKALAGSNDNQAASKLELLKRYGLWANARQRNWEDAASYAADLGDNFHILQSDESSSSHASPFSTTEEQNELINLKIQAFAATKSMDKALAMVQPIIADSATIATKRTINHILGFLMKQEDVRETKRIFHYCIKRQPQLVDNETYKMILESAFRTGSLELMNLALGESFLSAKELRYVLNEAVQTVVKSEENVSKAMVLVMPIISGMFKEDISLTTTNINRLLKNLFQNGDFQGAKGLYESCKSYQPALLDNTCHNLMLDCAAQMGDVELIAHVLGDIESVEGAIFQAIKSKNGGSSTAFNVLDKALDDMIMNKEYRPPTELLLQRILEAIATSAEKVRPSSFLQTLACRSMQVLASRNESSILSLDPKILSQLLISFEDADDVQDVLNCMRRSTPKKGPWYSGLSDTARIRILPIQLQFERNGGYHSVGGDAWQILMSLVAIESKRSSVGIAQKSLGIDSFTQNSREFLRCQSDHDFCKAVMYLCSVSMEDKPVLFKETVEDCWEALLRVEYTKRGIKLSFGNVIWMLKEICAEVYDDPTKLEMFEKIVNILKQTQFLAPVMDSGSPVEYSPQTTSKLDYIVNETVLLLRAISSAMVGLESIDQIGCKQFAASFAMQSMLLITSLDEYTAEYYWKHGASDNGAKEGLQMIMKELLLSKAVDDNTELITPAFRYFISLARISQSSSVIHRKALLYPYLTVSFTNIFRIVNILEHPSQCFRNCVLDESLSTSQEGSILFSMAKKAFTMLDGLMSDDSDDVMGDDSGYEGCEDIVSLMESVFGMAMLSDAEFPERNFTTSFENEYNDFFIQKKDLLCDRELFFSFCMALEFCQDPDIGLDDVEVDNSLQVGLEMAMRWPPRPGIAKSVIDRLQTGSDVSFWFREVVSKEGYLEARAERASYFLMNLYLASYWFDKFSDKETSESLLGYYVDECWFNTNYLVKMCTNEWQGSSSRKRRSRNELQEWKRFLCAMLDGFSDEVAKTDGKLDDIKLSGGMPLYEAMIYHLLNAFSHHAPASCNVMSVLVEDVLQDDNLHVKLKGPVRSWVDAVAPVKGVKDGT